MVMDGADWVLQAVVTSEATPKYMRLRLVEDTSSTHTKVKNT